MTIYTNSNKLFKFLLLCFLPVFIACNPSHEVFEKTVLNARVIADIGTNDLLRMLDEQSQLPGGESNKAPVTYREAVEKKIECHQQYLHEIELLDPKDEMEKDLKTRSVMLFKYAIQIENEAYVPFANMKDKKEDIKLIEQTAPEIDLKYRTRFQLLQVQLLDAATRYAAKNNIKFSALPTTYAD